MDYSQYANAGLENKTDKDVNIPVITICQASSPQFDATKPDHAQKKIEDIKPGHLFNSANNKIIKQPIEIIPCQYTVNYPEWKSGESSGAPVTVHKDESILRETVRNDKNKDVLPNGNYVETTYNFLVMFREAESDEWLPAIIRMKSTQIKNAKNWITVMDSIKMTTPDGTKFTPPTFSHTYSLTTGPENNKHGSWFGFVIKIIGPQEDSEVANQAIGMYESATSYLAEKKALPVSED